MKASNDFKTVIENHLQEVTSKDSLFAETLKKENKNIDGCINYILQTVQKSGCNGFADNEIFNMAIHYYDEDDLKPVAKINAQVVVNHSVEAKEPAKKAPKQVVKPTLVLDNQISMF